ncbi:hypothetical protein BYT27DRAFT_7193795 [Phlegmacium glaucopus]|nr:hypothetical protein BYT27DRAFT_7193795 [Phlegmacium glaucopus]
MDVMFPQSDFRYCWGLEKSRPVQPEEPEKKSVETLAFKFSVTEISPLVATQKCPEGNSAG